MVKLQAKQPLANKNEAYGARQQNFEETLEVEQLMIKVNDH